MKPSTQSLFYNKILDISCNILNAILKEKNRMLVWVQNGCKCVHFYSCYHQLTPVMALCCHPQLLERMVLKSPAPGKIKVQRTVYTEYILLLHHPKVKNHKLNHWKFRTIWMYVSKVYLLWASQVVLVVNNQFANARDAALIPELGRSLGEGNGNPLHYSCLENPMDRATWRAKVLRFQIVRHDWAIDHPWSTCIL